MICQLTDNIEASAFSCLPMCKLSYYRINNADKICIHLKIMFISHIFGRIGVFIIIVIYIYI